MCGTKVYVSKKKNDIGEVCGMVKCPAQNYDRLEVECKTPIKGEFITIVGPGRQHLVLCEVYAIGQFIGKTFINCI